MALRPRRLTVCIGSFVVSVLALFGGAIGGPAVLVWAIGCTIALGFIRRSHSGATRSLSTKLFLSMALMCLGFVVRVVHGEIVGAESPIPSPADLLHIPAYFLFLCSAVQVHRCRAPRRSTDAWLDAAAVVTSLIIVLWVGFYADYVAEESLSVATRIINGVYNVIILVAFSVFVRIIATPGRRPSAYYLLGLAGFAYFVVDLAASYSLVRGEGVFLTVALSPIVFGLLVSALSHPQVDEVVERDAESEVEIGWFRLSILATAILSPLSIGFFGQNQPGWSLAFMTVAVLVLAVLVVARVLLLLIGQREAALLDRRLAEHVALLGALDSKEAIIDQLHVSSRDLAPPNAVVDFAATKTETAFELPTDLQSDNRRYLVVSGVKVAPGRLRVLETLVRDAGLLGTAVDGLKAVERQRNEAETAARVAASERRFKALVERSTDMVVVISQSGRIEHISGAVSDILGDQELVGRKLIDFVHDGDRKEVAAAIAAIIDSDRPSHGEYRIQASTGESRLVELSLTDMCSIPEVGGIVVNANDVTRRRRLERDLLNAKVTDKLTSLPNRTGFTDGLDETLLRNAATDEPTSVVAINIRDFASVNEALGPVIADQVLADYAAKIQSAVRSGDFVARIGGDEFAVVLHDAATSDVALMSVRRTVEAISGPESVSGKNVWIGCYAGVVHCDNSQDATASGLLRDVDIALSAAKVESTSNIVLFATAMAEEAQTRLELRASMSKGLDDNEFRLVYQPVLSIKTGEIHSVEGLARWMHPQYGNVPPGTFIPLAESSGYILDLGQWAMRTACQRLASWQQEGLTGFSTSVNMSVHQLRQPRIVQDCEAIVNKAGVDPRDITVEVTESALIDDHGTVSSRLRGLRDLGFRLAIDDFGTGYSSLSHLQYNQFDILKVDKSFVDPLVDPTNVREQGLVQAIVDMAQRLGAETIAEGIEEKGQLDVLRDLGCDYAQGYYLHRPLEAEVCAEVIRQNIAEYQRV